MKTLYDGCSYALTLPLRVYIRKKQEMFHIRLGALYEMCIVFVRRSGVLRNNQFDNENFKVYSRHFPIQMFLYCRVG